MLELVEIAPGIDLQHDVLDQMEFVPVISDDLSVMDRRLFRHEKMNMELFGSLKDRVKWHPDGHRIFIDLFGISLATKAEVDWFVRSLDEILQPITKERGPVACVVNYDGFDLRSGLEEKYGEALEKVEQKHYRSVKRYSGKAFRLAKLREKANVQRWDADASFSEFDQNGTGLVSPEELRRGIRKTFGIKVKQAELDSLCRTDITRQNFNDVILECLRTCG